MYHQYKELHQAVKSKKSNEIKKAKVRWASKEAKDKGRDFYDVDHAKNIQTLYEVRVDL